MPHASTFDTQKFVEIMRDQVQEVSNRKFEGTTGDAMSQGFTYWCVKNINADEGGDKPAKAFDESRVRPAMAVCEGSGAGDEGIDAAWIHEGTLFFLETRYAAPSVTNGDEPTFRVPTFGPEGAEQLKEGFDRIRSYVKGETRRQARKYILLSELYEQATGQNLRIELVVAIGGTAKKPLIQKVKEINEEFEGNRKDFPKHHVSIYDLEWLNQKVSDSLARPPGTVYLETLNWFEI